MNSKRSVFGISIWLALVAGAVGVDIDAAKRGEFNMTAKLYDSAVWSKNAYESAWKQWGLSEKPQDYAAAFNDTYGLHAAPYPNHGLPMGLKQGQRLLGVGVGMDCLVCHGGSIFGKSYVGLGNSSLDIQSLFEDLSAADGVPFRTPFVFSNVRGTSEAGAMGVYLLARRNLDLSPRPKMLDLGVHDDMVEDPPAWWHYKRKSTTYATGGGDVRSVRALMQFMLGPLNSSFTIKAAENDFRDIQEFFKTIEAPKYPLPIDEKKAAEGKLLFAKHCAGCHGTYGPDGRYPNKIIPLAEIGTDRRRYDGLEERFGRYYNSSWFANEDAGWFANGYKGLYSHGYQAPPLDGVWATAPYLHNGSVPTVYHVLNSMARPALFTRSYRTNQVDYDSQRLGWKFQTVGGDHFRSDRDRRKIYDTSKPGRGNAGHTFGDDLTDDERFSVIEYLKTL